MRQMPSQTLLLKADSARIDTSQGKIFFEKFLAQQTISLVVLDKKMIRIPQKILLPYLKYIILQVSDE